MGSAHSALRAEMFGSDEDVVDERDPHVTSEATKVIELVDVIGKSEKLLPRRDRWID